MKFGDVLLTAGTLDMDFNSRRSFVIITKYRANSHDENSIIHTKTS